MVQVKRQNVLERSINGERIVLNDHVIFLKLIKDKEALVFELALFELPPTQTSVSDVYYENVHPISQVSDDSPFEFRIHSQNSTANCDLKNSQLCVKLKVEKTDGTALTTTYFYKHCFLQAKSRFKTKTV